AGGGRERAGVGVLGRPGRAGVVKDAEGGAVEAHEPLFSPEPQITLPCLENGFDGVLGKALLGSPDVMPVLSDCFAGVEAERWAGPPEQEKHRAGEVQRCPLARPEEATRSAA